MTTTSTAACCGHAASSRSSARRGSERGSGLGTVRWVVERGFAHLHTFGRLRTRYERDPAIHTAFLTLAYAILCWRRLTSL